MTSRNYLKITIYWPSCGKLKILEQQLAISENFSYLRLWQRLHNRRAWLFSDTPEGAKASAAMFSIIETAKANGIEPSIYLQYVLTNICAADTDEALEALMPWNMKLDSQASSSP